MKTLAQRLVAVRGEQTQEAFAQKLGVSVWTLRNWEQGRRHPRGLAARLLDQFLETLATKPPRKTAKP